jgi:hypothetical protein
MKNLPALALIWILMACASAPPVAPGIAGTYELVSVDGGPLPSVDGIVDGTLELRGNRTFTWRFTMQEVDEGGNLSLAPILFEGRFAVDEGAGTGLRILLTRRDRTSSLSGSEEEIEGTLTGGTLTFRTPELNAVFSRLE